MTSLGEDADYVFLQISLLLCQSIEAKLHAAWVEQESTIPLSLLAQAMTGIYMSLLRGVAENHSVFSPELLAETITRLNQALLRAAIHKG